MTTGALIPNFDKITGFATKSIICTPLLFKGKLLGVIQAINPLNGPDFTDEDMNLFKVFADQAALAVQNAIYFQNALEEERIKSELSSARAIQEALIPDVDMRFGSIRITARSITAREIGGEFHGLFRLDGDHVGIALGDLHVKGVPGGLHASIVSGAIRALAKVKGKNPVELVRLLHLIMEHDERPVRNASLLYGVLELPKASSASSTPASPTRSWCVTASRATSGSARGAWGRTSKKRKASRYPSCPGTSLSSSLTAFSG